MIVFWGVFVECIQSVIQVLLSARWDTFDVCVFVSVCVLERERERICVCWGINTKYHQTLLSTSRGAISMVVQSASLSFNIYYHYL